MHEFCARKGQADPLGVSFNKEFNEINFCLFSEHATSVTLCLFSSPSHLIHEVDLDPKTHKTGSLWHILVKGPFVSPLYYGYHVEGPQHSQVTSESVLKFDFDKKLLLLDPFAKQVSSSNKWGENRPYSHLGVVSKAPPFDWQGVTSPNHSLNELIIYEMHVRGFTKDPSSDTKNPGTFLGVIEKIPHLVALGITAVELMPIHEFNEMEVKLINPSTGKPLCNFWGYSTVNFFSPMNRFAVGKDSFLEFKTLVRELHRHGIEVILDVVFNHTAEGDENGPILSFKGIDKPVYYMHNKGSLYANYSGCGNTFNCNHPVVINLILQSLRYYAIEAHVDGFRFDLTSILTRGRHGEPLDPVPLIEAITEDPLLQGKKWIAEPWDAGGLFQLGFFGNKSPKWSEWNGKYRDIVRRFLKGNSQVKGDFVTRLCGSQDIFFNTSPNASINFITAHDGFTLKDLVSYNEKHNSENGEEGRDGSSYNDSWNCGVEGETTDQAILQLRDRQMRNLHLALLISKGIPMLLMGDEYGHTKKGNNNSWCHDNKLNYILWDELEKNPAFFRFTSLLINFRKNNPLIHQGTFLQPKEADWHGSEPFKPNWAPNNNFLAFTLLDEQHGEDIYIAFNPAATPLIATLPAPRGTTNWHQIANTAALSPLDAFEETLSPPLLQLQFEFAPYSALLLKAKK